MKKQRKRSKTKALKLVKTLISTNGNKAEAARILKVTPQAIQDQVINNPLVKEGWAKYTDELDKIIPQTDSIHTIARGLAAQKEHRDMSGTVVDRSPDHAIRLKANEQYLKIKGLIKDDRTVENNTQVNVYNFKDAKTEDLLRSIDAELRAIKDRELRNAPPTNG
jgi:hypothetical protein